MKILLKIRVDGFVQGVGFRYFAYKVANELGITGLVRNEPDGSVYIEACGEKSSLEEFKKRLSIGPSRSNVSSVTVIEEGICEGNGGFYIS